MPKAPTKVIATAGNASAKVTWIAPSNGGSAIKAYRVIPSSKGVCTVSGTTANCTGLINGSVYTFSVSAINALGTGPVAKSNAVKPIAPITKPGIPTNVKVVVGNSFATLSWTAPSNGGSPITGYTVTPRASGTCTVSGTTAHCTGLTNGIAYTFTVAAINAAGKGYAAQSNSVKPTTKPGAPTNVTVVVGNGSATLHWTAPNNGGSPITGYTVIPSAGGSCTVSGITANCTGLNNGKAYTFSIYATNALGNGPSINSNSVIPANTPEAPSDMKVEAGNASAKVSWTAPNDGGSKIIQYTVVTQPKAGLCEISGTSANCTGLSNGTAYTFSVRATNAAGDGPATNSSSVTPFTFPGKPSNVIVIPGNASAQVFWGLPDDGGSEIIKYTVTTNPNEGTCTVLNPTTANCTGLRKGTAYTFSVYASNAAGDGPSDSLSSVLPFTIPGKPSNVTLNLEDDSVIVRWIAPEDDGGAVITKYTVTTSPNVGKCIVSGTSANCTDLRKGTEYTFFVSASNVLGEGLRLVQALRPHLLLLGSRLM